MGTNCRPGVLARAITGNITDPHLSQLNLRRYAWTLFRTNLDKATSLFDQLLQDAKRADDREMEANALDDLAQTRRGKADTMGGFQLHQQAWEIYREIGDRRGQAEALGGMGACIYDSFPDKAIGYLQEATDIQREFNNMHSLTFLLRTLGMSYTGMGQVERAMTSYEEALTIARDLKNLTNVSAALIMMGMTCANWGKYEMALDYEHQAIAIATELSGDQISLVVLFASNFLE